MSTKNKRTRASSKNPSSVPSLTPAMQELRNGWKRGQPLPAALRVHALELVDSGVSPGQVARLVGVSPESIRLWRKRVAVAPSCPPASSSVSVAGSEPEDEPASGTSLTPESGPAPVHRDPANGLSVTEQEGTLKLKEKHPSMGPAQIRVQLKRFQGWRISVRAIARFLKQKGYDPVHVTSVPRGEVINRFEAPHRNSLWQMDFVELRVGPERVSLLLVIDDFSRFCVVAELMTEVSSEAVVESLRASIRLHGKPESIYTDRGGPFLSWRTPSSLGNFLEAELIDHHVSPSYRPQGRGKIESLAGTVQRELWQVVHFSSIEEARERTRSFFRWYNHSRAHMGIDGLTPADRYFGRWEEVRAQVEAASRGRQLALMSGSPAGSAVEEVTGPGGPAEVFRLVCQDGRLQMRFLGHHVDLGAVQT